MAETTKEEVDKVLKERVFLAIAGLSLPSQHDAVGLPCIAAPLSPTEEGRHLSFEMLRKPFQAEPGSRWPRRGMVRMGAQLVIGTIDEMVAKFREQLEAAARIMLANYAAADQPSVDHAQAVADAQEMYGYTPGKATVSHLLDLGTSRVALNRYIFEAECMKACIKPITEEPTPTAS